MSAASPTGSPCDHDSSYGNGNGTRTCVTCGVVFPARPEDHMEWPSENAGSASPWPADYSDYSQADYDLDQRDEQ